MFSPIATLIAHKSISTACGSSGGTPTGQESRRDGWPAGIASAEKIAIPGVPQAQGIGEPTPRQKSFFMEPFCIRRSFQTPPLQERQRLWLRVGGILPAGEVYLNGQYVGYTKTSRTQQRVDVTRFAMADGGNLLAIKVCDFPKVRLDGIWEMAECAKNWMGVYGPVSCELTDRVHVADTYVSRNSHRGRHESWSRCPKPTDSRCEQCAA